MFGLMRAKTCGLTAEEKNFRRLNYCGTCKTMGAIFSEKSRLLLNHDTVFLAEFLSVLSGENAKDWEKSYQSFNCLNLPKSQMPVSLQFAAAANVFLTEFKLADQIADERKSIHKLAGKIFSKDFLTARNLLNEWSFPLEEIESLLDSQQKIEADEKDLEKFAFPTAQTTAIFFREGAKLVGKNEFSENAFKLGFEFGRLIYLLDAFEDYEKDFRKKQFNAFRTAFDLKSATLGGEDKRRILNLLQTSEAQISEKIREFSFSENQKNIFISRLSQNLQRKLKTNLPVLKTKRACQPKKKISFSEKWQKSKETARNLARNYSWQMPLVFLFVFVFALVAPAQSREAKSARECFDLSFNLMFLGAIFGSVLAFPKSVLMPMPKIRRQEKPPEEKERWCDYCDCDCCDCCDCDCGDGCCDGCNCCDGCDCCSCDCGS